MQESRYPNTVDGKNTVSFQPRNTA